MDEAELREKLAAYAHEAWSGWMRYQRARDPKGWAALKGSLRDRWTRQMTTLYADLPEEEKKSDRFEADKMLAIMDTEVQRVRSQRDRAMALCQRAEDCALRYDGGTAKWWDEWAHYVLALAAEIDDEEEHDG